MAGRVAFTWEGEWHLHRRESSTWQGEWHLHGRESGTYIGGRLGVHVLHLDLELIQLSPALRDGLLNAVNLVLHLSRVVSHLVHLKQVAPSQSEHI